MSSYSPQNGIAERIIRHVTEFGLALLFQAHMPMSYWSDAFTTACYLINRLPKFTTEQSTPLELLFHKRPDYSFLRVFDCLTYPCLRSYNTNKLEPRSVPCVLIGYSNAHKGYQCLHRQSGRLYISRHVRFEEQTFPFKPMQQHVPVSNPGITPSDTSLLLTSPFWSRSLQFPQDGAEP